jgi:hypothetical protein
MVRELRNLERDREEEEDEDEEKSFIGVGGAVLIVFGAVAIYFFVTAKPDQKPVAVPEPVTALSMTDSVQCDRLVRIATREGIVRGERVGSLVSVDEQRWATLKPRDRQDLMEAIACAAYSGRSLDELGAQEHVLLYGVQSGKLLVKAGSHAGGVVGK